MQPTLEIHVYGTVQGVGFRYSTKQIADQLGIVGTVENLADGSVKILAQGDYKKLDELVAKIKDAPSPSAEVVDASIKFTKLPAFTDFKTI
ncbi:acylphosphatase [Nicoliella lavandulae]|uniref:acylphosphatase n=1 Tax=Nicoliella lavandulae TaxID=3082954 RepID=A0ABU8SKT6_9LACO